jgi:hypothetical protein
MVEVILHQQCSPCGQLFYDLPCPPIFSQVRATLLGVFVKLIDADVSCALYGLGDSSYEKFCYAGKMLGRRLVGLGAEMLGEPMWGDERAPNG